MARGNYVLWQVPSVGYVSLVQVTGSITADRADIATSFLVFLDEIAPHQDWAVHFPGLPVPSEPAGSLAPGPVPPTPGVVDSVRPDLVAGALSTTVTLDRPGTLLLSVAYDPGWHASVDGRPVQTELLAPALIGVQLGPGRHVVAFHYRGFGWYPELWALGALGLVGLGMAGHKRR
jgi:hypothetical protein